MRTFVILLSTICMISLSSCTTKVVTRPASVTIVKTPPRHYKIVKVKGRSYYFWNGNHYRKTKRGYVITRV
ncbi:DUF6515 family protein [Hyunsoonleella pacifica]|uniref:SH3 domain-containing protein n=1 Tax=Hyunsoonleella pacifica TaxID=1080224 RepID=A0A4V2JB49_9FLAO|nr:DUF6515 family protein [Hyunsoonleella pacifica]TBN16773.1 hypothetical protein EYD46_09090 [Hyunsoonleella pacifica]GGD16517.1 hypothetical protein GCM10011368_18110 [Hyunsoonleella pacifica]